MEKRDQGIHKKFNISYPSHTLPRKILTKTFLKDLGLGCESIWKVEVHRLPTSSPEVSFNPPPDKDRRHSLMTNFKHRQANDSSSASVNQTTLVIVVVAISWPNFHQKHKIGHYGYQTNAHFLLTIQP